MFNNNLISIIIPVYNEEEYLEKCIESVLIQSYENFELLLINDGSTDSSGKIIDIYAAKDNRIRVFHQINSGVSAARNFGIEESKGDFICFVDSDDSVDEDYVRNFIDTKPTKDRIIVQEITRSHNGIVQNKTGNYTYGSYSTQGYDRIFNDNNILFNGYAHAKLYSRSLLDNNNLRFDPNLKYCEDLLFFLRAISYADEIVFTEYDNYNYNFNSSSASILLHEFESEYLLSQKINEALLNLIPLQMWHCFDQIGISNGERIIRCLNSLYQVKCRKTLQDRLSCIKTVNTTENLEYMIKYGRTRKRFFLESSIIYLMKNKRLRLVDLLMTITTPLKRELVMRLKRLKRILSKTLAK